MIKKPANLDEKKLRLLMVDDNRDVIGMLSLLLRRVGHEVEVTYDGVSALEAARRMRPDAVLLDIGLPGMNGYEVAQHIRNEPGLESVFLIAMTGYGQEEDLARAREAGFDHHLLKPARLDAIRKVLARCQPSARTSLAASAG